MNHEIESSRQRVSATVGDAFRVELLLGRGGQAEVWRAVETSLDRHVAIKVIRPDAADLGNFAERLRREAQSIARIQSPYVVPILQLGTRNDSIFLVMPYIPGLTVADLISRDGRIAAEMAVRILIDVARALSAAHAESLLHRDVKPSNVIVNGKTGQAMLADFGLARALEMGESSLTVTGVTVGTPLYMSPEQFSQPDQVGTHSDVYSLGVMGFEMLTGEPPFKGSLPRLVMLHTTEQPEPLHLRPEVPTSVGLAILKCLAKDPADRPSALVFEKMLIGDQAITLNTRKASGRFMGSFRILAVLMSIGVVSLLSIPFRDEMRGFLKGLMLLLEKLIKAM